MWWASPINADLSRKVYDLFEDSLPERSRFSLMKYKQEEPGIAE